MTSNPLYHSVTISVGTHDLCVRCRTTKQVLISSPLTGTDALPLDTFVRPDTGRLGACVRCRMTRVIRWDPVRRDKRSGLPAVIFVAIPACHIVFDVVRYVVSLLHVPNDAVIEP